MANYDAEPAIEAIQRNATEPEPTVADLIESAQQHTANMPVRNDPAAANAYEALSALCEAILLQQREAEAERAEVARINLGLAEIKRLIESAIESLKEPEPVPPLIRQAYHALRAIEASVAALMLLPREATIMDAAIEALQAAYPALCSDPPWPEAAPDTKRTGE
jgi:hypothetical protein